MSEPREVTAPVEQVTVFEDRAQIRRTARLELAAGVHCLRVEQITPLVVDRTLRGTVSGSLQLRQVTIRRESSLFASRPELERELGEEIHRLKQDYLAGYDRLTAAEAEQRLLERCSTDWLQACSLDAGRGRAGRQADWGAGFLRLEGRQEAVAAEIREAREATDELAERLEQLGERQFLAMQPTSATWGRLEAIVEVVTGGPCEVTWDYLCPCALWRPVHRAELREELHWTLGGMIWQRTGEDWSRVALGLSTARPTVGAKVPLLEEDLLRHRPKTEAEQAAVTVESRDEAVAALAPQAPGATTLQVPGVDDGGEVRHFQVAAPISIPSDGRAHLVDLGSLVSPVTLDRVCHPELGGHVLLRSRQTNTGQHPLLAGPVTLIRDGGFSGRSRCDFVGPGEAFELGWGPLDGLQVVRRLDESEEGLSVGRGQRRRCRVRLYLSNTGAEAQRIQVVERIPISELADVRVRIVSEETTPGARPDDHGHLRWDLDLGPAGHRELTLVYEVESSRRVVWS